ncbi:MAG TPA: hypothetical protein VFB85_07630 [Vicinamibacterales bacterium]|nr:hypothetical protein [Vicinamibacterales bacterium]
MKARRAPLHRLEHAGRQRLALRQIAVVLEANVARRLSARNR